MMSGKSLNFFFVLSTNKLGKKLTVFAKWSNWDMCILINTNSWKFSNLISCFPGWLHSVGVVYRLVSNQLAVLTFLMVCLYWPIDRMGVCVSMANGNDFWGWRTTDENEWSKTWWFCVHFNTGDDADAGVAAERTWVS